MGMPPVVVPDPTKFILRTGDMIQFTFLLPVPPLIPAIIAPVPLIGTSKSLIVGGMPVCLLGDELPPPLLAPLQYTSPATTFTNDGGGTLKVTLTPGTHYTVRTMNGKPILIVGTPFPAIFSVKPPATNPLGAADPAPAYTGTAMFISTNATVMAS